MLKGSANTSASPADLALDCVPCFVRNALNAARIATMVPEIHEQILREALLAAASWDRSRPAPAMSQHVHRRLHELTGNADPYSDLKRRFNELALQLLPELRTAVERADSPFAYALRLAIAGNVIDLGVTDSLSDEDIRLSLRQVLAEPFVGDICGFQRVVTSAKNILYLADNSGEIVFDRLFIEQLSLSRVTLAVRGMPILNDATRADAAAAGIDQIVRVIDNGSDAPGTILEDCSPAFRKSFDAADVIIAKGQGNFESLRNAPARIFFLFKVKCPVVACQTGLEVGTQALVDGNLLR